MNQRSVASKVASVTVAYNPEAKRFAAQLETLLVQVDRVIVVDNGSCPPARKVVEAAIAERVVWILEATNQGIAAALNHGIDAARLEQHDLVLCMDHDSIPEQGMVERLTATLIELERSGKRVAAVGPKIVDRRAVSEFPFVRLGWLRNQKIRCSDGCAPVWCDFLITSGSLARVVTFTAHEVGVLDESLFIDSVDMEWCYRARARGYALYGICEATLDHRLGDDRRLVWPGVWLVVHSPLRLYYMTRNRIALYRRGYIPLKWKLKDVLRMCAKLISILIFVAPRRRYLAMSMLAARDALSGASGAFNAKRAR
jgi:rhamnosyltransferase